MKKTMKPAPQKRKERMVTARRLAVETLIKIEGGGHPFDELLHS